jgi:ADP-ribose pyrophosphatase YjhB (NUDIX family)
MHFSDLFRYCPGCGSESFEPHNEKAMKCPDCGFTYYINPSAATAAFIRNHKGDLLVCIRAKEPAKGAFDLPGGFVDNDEAAEEAIVREVREETGARPLSAEYLFSIPNLYEYSGLSIPTLDLFFECTIDENTPLKASDDVAECFFLPVKEIDAGKFGLRSIKQAVARYLEDNK